MDFLHVKLGRHGKDYKYDGGFGFRKLIEVFVEIHFLAYGRPTQATWEAIQTYSDELQAEHPNFK